MVFLREIYFNINLTGNIMQKKKDKYNRGEFGQVIGQRRTMSITIV